MLKNMAIKAGMRDLPRYKSTDLGKAQYDYIYDNTVALGHSPSASSLIADWSLIWAITCINVLAPALKIRNAPWEYIRKRCSKYGKKIFRKIGDTMTDEEMGVVVEAGMTMTNLALYDYMTNKQDLIDAGFSLVAEDLDDRVRRLHQ